MSVSPPFGLRLRAAARSLLGNRVSQASMAFGVMYGLMARAVATDGERHGLLAGSFTVMSLAFLCVVPIAIGMVTTSTLESPTLPRRIFRPWVPVLLAVTASAAVGWEGSICIVMSLPLLLVGASLGGIAGTSRTARRPGVRPAIVCLPFLLGPIEERVAPIPARLARTTTEIVIAAPPDAVWPLVASVDSIRADELRPALYTAMGFPIPVSATLDGTGIGAVRRARFERGLVFTERVTTWAPGERIAFTIEADTREMLPMTLDPHVTIGGPYFDVTSGTYELHAIDGGRATRLVLWSEHRTSTRFNPYARWWVDRIMTSIQRQILSVHKLRAERV